MAKTGENLAMGQWLDKSTPPPVVAVVRNIRNSSVNLVCPKIEGAYHLFLSHFWTKIWSDYSFETVLSSRMSTRSQKRIRINVVCPKIEGALAVADQKQHSYNYNSRDVCMSVCYMQMHDWRGRAQLFQHQLSYICPNTIPRADQDRNVLGHIKYED